MGWGTTFNTDIYLSRQMFTNEYQIEEKIKDNEEIINGLKQKLMMYASCNPSEIVPEDWSDSAIDFLQMKFKEIFEELEDFQLENYKLSLYLESYPFNKND